MDSHKRSIAKTLSWRFFATIITFAVALIITHKLTFAAEVGVLDTTIKLGAYFAHERIWNRIQFGQIAPPPAEYEI